MTTKLVIVDYEMGNLHSVKKKFNRLNVNVTISADAAEISKADKVILPGIGHFKKAMDNLEKLRLLEVLNEHAIVHKKPILGICLGMQILASESEEGNSTGLGWLPGKVVKFTIHDKLKFKVPQMGWNQISIKKQSALMRNIPDMSEFYFVHAYHFNAFNTADVLNESEYETTFVSAVERDNIFGVQYHPEKSHDVGDILLKNFIEL
jgi:glutamine amidotransferase